MSTINLSNLLNSTYQGDVGFTGSKGALLPWSLVSTNYSIADGDRILVNSSGGSFNITLPGTPATGVYFQISDGGNLSTNPVTVLRNGSTIEGFADDLILSISNTTYEFIYDGSTWQVTVTAGPTGFVGSAGFTGSIGFTGSQGVGFTGSTGFAGSAGSTGFTGSAGTDGFTGSTGFTGSQGVGFTGSAGSTGFTGSAGTDGFTGSTGFTGSQGPGITTGKAIAMAIVFG
jgi:hypothetical protein